MDFSVIAKGKVINDPEEMQAVMKEQHLRPIVRKKIFVDNVFWKMWYNVPHTGTVYCTLCDIKNLCIFSKTIFQLELILRMNSTVISFSQNSEYL